jgi:hypothetical protein
MKIKFLHSVKGYAYFAGDVCDIDDARGSVLVAAGSAIIIPDTEGDVNTLPDGLPFRQLLFDNGFETVTDILNAKSAVPSIKGIGPKGAARIFDWIRK